MSLRLGDTAPDFSAITTEGRIQFHTWAGSDWVVFLCSSPGGSRRFFPALCLTPYLLGIGP